MYCPNCGTAMEDDAHFCRRCGHVLNEPTGATPPGAPAPAPEPAPTGATRFEPFPTAPPPSAPPPPMPPMPPGTPWQSSVIGGDGPYAVFGAPLARWWQRVGSLILDYLIIGIPSGIVAAAIGGRHSTVDANGTVHAHGNGTFLLVFTLAAAVYFTILNGTGVGQTIGNRAPGIAVRDVATGTAIGPGRGLLRWFVRFVLYVLVIPGIVNDLMPLWDRQRQSIADKAAHSVVIRLR